MKALTFLEFMGKIGNEISDCRCMKLDRTFTKDELEYYSNRRILKELRYDYYDLNITKALKFWNQKSTIELIKELFKFKGIDEKYSRFYVPENEQKIKYITLTNNMVFKNDNLGKVYKIPYPSTLDMFISNCKQCEIDLEWEI